MANFTDTPNGGTAGIQAGLGAGKYVNVAAAAISVALIGGVGVWGLQAFDARCDGCSGRART